MIGIAVVYLLFGLAMLFVPQFQEKYIIYIAGLIFLICGVIMIVKYFMAASYNDLGNYGFSGGVLCILLGICQLVRTQQIAGYLPIFLGVCILLTAVIKLQNAVDLKSLHNGGWPVFLIIALAFLAAAVLVILNPDGKILQHREVLYYILIADGAISIISPIYLIFAIRSGRKVKHVRRKDVDDVILEDHTSETAENRTEKEKTQKKEDGKEDAKVLSGEKAGKKWRKKNPSEESKEETVDPAEHAEESEQEKQTADSKEETIDHISKEILSFFDDEDE